MKKKDEPVAPTGPIAPGDFLVVEVPDVVIEGRSTSKPLFVAGDGTIQPLMIGAPVRVEGMTTLEAQDAIAKAYRTSDVLQQAQVNIRRLPVPAGALGPIGPFDLLRVCIWDVKEPGDEDVRIGRVGRDGLIGVPLIDKQKVTGLTATQAERAIVDAIRAANKQQQPNVSILRLEPAPADASKL